MKSIEELGISPLPWRFCGGRNPSVIGGVESVHGLVYPVVCDIPKESNHKPMKMRNADARLMAAAPELYEALREAVLLKCSGCASDAGARCLWDGECYAKKWRAALEKAGGAE